MLLALTHNDDVQAQRFRVIARERAFPSHFFFWEMFGRDWDLVNEAGVYYLITGDRRRLPLSGPTTAVYIRMPWMATGLACHAFMLASDAARASGNCVHGRRCGSTFLADSKPAQLVQMNTGHPDTRVLHPVNAENPPKGGIVKGMSQLQAVARDANEVESFRSGVPSMVQERIAGTAVKLHCFIPTSSSAMFFAVRVQSRALDFRTDRSARFEHFPVSHELALCATTVAETFGLIFFDMDFVEGTNGQYHFLEFNQGPCPAFFEKRMPGAPDFSGDVLERMIYGVNE